MTNGSHPPDSRHGLELALRDLAEMARELEESSATAPPSAGRTLPPALHTAVVDTPSPYSGRVWVFQ